MDDRSFFEPDELPEDLLEVIKPELAPGERLLWAAWANARAWRGNSGSRVVALWATGFVILSLVCFSSFFGILGPRLSQMEAVGPAGLVTGFIGFLLLLHMIGSRLSAVPGKAFVKRKCYALTDRRAIVWNPRIGTKAVEVFSYHRGKIKGLHRAEYPDGSGDVIFGRGDEQDVFSPIGFLGVAEVRRVEDLARRVLIVPDSEQP